MPTYDYRCPNGHDFEHFFRKISDASAEFACPVCGAIAVRKVSGGAGLVFKGSGFYLTDYGKNAHRKPGLDSGGSDSKGDSGDSKGASSTGSSKSDSAPAAKPESSAAKSETPKGTEAKPTPKTKGGDSK
jgi:putative FmdB family regulatory protein